MKTIIAILLLTICSSAQDYTKSEIEEIAKTASLKGKVIDELKMYSRTGSYDVYFEFDYFKEKPHKVGPIPAVTKIAAENIIIMTSPLPDGQSLYMLITYDKKTKVYKKYSCIPKAPLTKLIGVGTKNSNSIAWTAATPAKQVILSQEYNDSKGSNWYTVIYENGKAVRAETGSAIYKE